ncbi:MAG: gamma-glutamyl-gamma-aminobutyrate hydrolase family protein [Bacteroidales bacterium]|nr:gamma-glutamyl-gamma-aminobutyrate hydrolase family protein [Bacteroidales bacterium]
MKKLLIIIFFYLPFVVYSQIISNLDSLNDKTDYIVITHPTVSNLKNFKYLTDNKVIKLNNFHLLCIYYKNEKYDYEQTIKYIQNNFIQNIYLYEIKGQLNPLNLFSENSFSELFYKIFNLSKGILFFGGPDIPPKIYGEKTNLLTVITDPHRHYFEISFLFHLLGGSQNEDFKPFLNENPDYPVWAFCLGLQSMNVATGGSLYQDIPHQIYNENLIENILKFDNDNIHKNYRKLIADNKDISGGCFHKIKFIDKEFFIKKMGFEKEYCPVVYSYHHQCIKKLGKNLQVIAVSMDRKIIESVNHKIFGNVLGFQFHPEKSDLYNPEKLYKLSPDKKAIPFVEIINKSNSKLFYDTFWNYFSEIIK